MSAVYLSKQQIFVVDPKTKQQQDFSYIKKQKTLCYIFHKEMWNYCKCTI